MNNVASIWFQQCVNCKSESDKENKIKQTDDKDIFDDPNDADDDGTGSVVKKEPSGGPKAIENCPKGDEGHPNVEPVVPGQVRPIVAPGELPWGLLHVVQFVSSESDDSTGQQDKVGHEGVPVQERAKEDFSPPHNLHHSNNYLELKLKMPANNSLKPNELIG